MNENVKIDYDTAEKVMDLDGCGLRHTAAPATPDPAQVQGVRQNHRRQDVYEDHDDTRLQLGKVRRAEAAQAPGRLVPGPPPASETLRRRRALYCNTTQAWCPATHFGYQTQGTCKIKFEDGTETTINAGDSYLVDKPHLPEIIGDETVIMHEFSQQVKKVLDSMKD